MIFRAITWMALSALVLTLTSGCLMDRTPPPPPFRVQEYGPGFESSSPGRLVKLTQHEDDADAPSTIGRLRVSAHSMRLQEDDAVPIGSIRLTTEGYAFRDRSGQTLCTLSDSAHHVTCENEREWTATPYDDRVIITRADGDARILPIDAHNTVIETAGTTWAPHAATLIYRAYGEHTGDTHTFAAYTLLAWSLRSQNDTANREGEQ